MSTRNLKKKQLLTKPIAIVCEGKETEHPYFAAAVEYAKQQGIDLDVKILSDRSKGEEKKRGVSRQLQNENPDTFGDGERYLYYEKYEIEKTKYDLYKQQPIRYVREAQLFLYDGYEEAWAVFDYDVQDGKKDDKAHKAAFIIQDQDTNRNQKIDERLHIAFSSYSFEEWFLLHFERPQKGFNKSMCDEYGGSLKEHKKNQNVPIGCSCNECLAGYLNSNNLIKDYDKSKAKEYFENCTMPHFHKACINASWLRAQNVKPICERNPYSDVDRLMIRLLGKDWDIKWPKMGETFNLGKEKYRLVRSNGGVTIIHEGTNPSAIISSNDIFWCDESNDYKQSKSACKGANINFKNSKKNLLANKPAGKAILCIKSGNQEFYFEID